MTHAVAQALVQGQTTATSHAIPTTSASPILMVHMEHPTAIVRAAQAAAQVREVAPAPARGPEEMVVPRAPRISTVIVCRHGVRKATHSKTGRASLSRAPRVMCCKMEAAYKKHR